MTVNFKSILARIIGLQAVAFAVVSALVLLVGYLLLNSASVKFENQTLRTHANTVASHLVQVSDGSVKLNLPRNLSEFYEKELGGLAYTVTDDNNRVLFSSHADELRFLENDPRTGQPIYRQSPNQRRSLLGLSVPVKVGDCQLWVQITRIYRRPGMITGDVIVHFFSDLGWLIFPGILLILVIDYLVVRHALRPVIAASERAQAIDPARLDVRLPTRDLPSEVLPLVRTVNTALERVEQGFKLQREFTADAAHELRTPLSVLRMRIDTLEDRETAEALRCDVEAMSHVVEQLFAVAELEDGAVAANEVADLAHVCRDVIELVAPIALAQGKDIALNDGDAVLVHGNTGMLFQAVRNLADNAIRFAPVGTTVEIRVEPEGLVRVRDEGPGVPEAERELVFRRFWRRKRSHGGGSGLGLAIVSRVAELHGGAVSIVNHPDGGAVFTLDLSQARLVALGMQG